MAKDYVAPGQAPGAWHEPSDTGTGMDKPTAAALREKVIGRSGAAVLSLDGQPRLLIDFDRALAVTCPDDAAADVLAAGFHRLVLAPLSTREFNDGMARAQSCALAPLLWNMALQVRTDPPLLMDLGRGGRLSLQQWPDFRALAHRHDHFRLSSLLLKRPCSVAEAADLLELDARTVQAFFNAAWLSGHAAVVAAVGAEAARPAALPGRRTSGGHATSALARMWQSVRRTMAGGA